MRDVGPVSVIVLGAVVVALGVVVAATGEDAAGRLSTARLLGAIGAVVVLAGALWRWSRRRP